jgi:hypothetical protein
MASVPRVAPVPTVDERGSATIEVLAGSVLVTALIGGGLAISYVSFARTWLDRNSYEASICLATDATRDVCEKRFRRNVERGLPIGKLEHAVLERGEREVATRGRWKLNDAVELSFEDRRRLPLGVRR